MQRELAKIFEEFGDPTNPMGWYYLISIKWQIYDLMGDIEIEKEKLREEKRQKALQPKDQYPEP